MTTSLGMAAATVGRGEELREELVVEWGGIAADSVMCRRNWPLVPPLSRRGKRRIIVTYGQPLDVVLPVLGHWLVEGGLEADVGNAVLLCDSLILQRTTQPMCNAGM